MIYATFDELVVRAMPARYRCIVADPPWSYRNKNTGGSLTSGSAAQYPTMPVSELAALPVPAIAAPDSILFLWATTPLLPDAFRLMAVWGFSYKTAIYWDKQNYPLGFWFRGRVEPCLVGIRGKVPAFRSRAVNMIAERARKHSAKPEAFWSLIEPPLDRFELSPRIELFARCERSGWDALGNDITRWEEHDDGNA